MSTDMTYEYVLEFADIGAIKKASLNLNKNKLNVNYGINGIGKSTIVNAILNEIGTEINSASIVDLELKKYGTENEPEIKLPEEIKTAIVFNQSYVDRYLYKKDVVNDSFKIVVESEEYKHKKELITKSLEELVQISQEKVFGDFRKLSDAQKRTISFNKPNKDGQRALNGQKAYARGRLSDDFEQNIVKSKEISGYAPYLVATNNFAWKKWHEEGSNFELENKACPYCLNVLQTNFDSIKKKD